MNEFLGFLLAASRPLTEATIVGTIIAGIVISLIYWRNVKVQIYNGIIFNAIFFVAVYVARRSIDGITTAAAYFGIFLLYVIFITAAWITHRLSEKYINRKK